MQIVKDAVQAVLSFSSDAIIIVVLVALGTIYGLAMGKRRIISLIISFYPAAFIFRYLPSLKYTASNPALSNQAFAQIGLFLLILIPIHLILNQFIVGEFHFSGVRKLSDSLLLGGSLAALIILFSYQVVNLQSVYNFSSSIDSLFTGNLILIWLVLPFVALFATKE